MTTLNLDTSRVDAFAARIHEHLNGAAVLLMTAIGHRTGLFDTMAGMAPSTSAEIAARAGLQERYVREWLGAMVTGKVVEYDAESRNYRLPPEHAACLTRAASSNNLAVMVQWVSVLGAVEDRVVDAFVRGGGVPHEAFVRAQAVMVEHGSQSLLSSLDDHVLPLLGGFVRRLERGIAALDLCCRNGAVVMHLAKRFPRSHFWGLDPSEEAIAAARADASRRGIENAHFEVGEAETLAGREHWELITAFDNMHGQAAPAIVLSAIRGALGPSGVFLMQEPKVSSHLHENLDHPLGAFLYTLSCMHCMTVSLAKGGPGLGACWGHQSVRRMLREAGFSRIERCELTHDWQNDYWLARL